MPAAWESYGGCRKLRGTRIARLWRSADKIANTFVIGVFQVGSICTPDELMGGG